MDATTPERLPPLPEQNASWALFFDIDGTLAELVAHPDDVVIPTPVAAALEALFERLEGAVAIVSGRPIDQIDALLSPLVLPAAGLHGLERRNRADGSIERVPPPPWRSAVIPMIERFAARYPGVWLEDKGITLALHYRAMPDLEGEVAALTDTIRALDCEGLVVQEGKMIAEYRPGGADKGDAIEGFMAAPPFENRLPVFLGDDVTDEHGFAVVKQAGGIAARIGPMPDTQADWTFRDVAQARHWILKTAKALRTGGKTQ